jgi:hypothetical protein
MSPMLQLQLCSALNSTGLQAPGARRCCALRLRGCGCGRTCRVLLRRWLALGQQAAHATPHQHPDAEHNIDLIVGYSIDLAM